MTVSLRLFPERHGKTIFIPGKQKPASPILRGGPVTNRCPVRLADFLPDSDWEEV